MKHGGAVLGLLSLLGYVAAGGSCSTATEPYEDVERWLCCDGLVCRANMTGQPVCVGA